MRTNAANFTRLIMSAQTGPTGLSFEVPDTSGTPDAPFYAVLNLRDDARREVVLFSSKTGTTLEVDSIGDRYLDGSVAGSGITHPVGTQILLAPLAQHLEDLWDDFEALDFAVNTLELDDLSDVDVAGVADGDVLVYDDYAGEWVAGKAAAGAVGGGDDEVFWENDQAVTVSYTISAGKNAMTAGPVELDVGVTVEVPAGSVWTVV